MSVVNLRMMMLDRIETESGEEKEEDTVTNTIDLHELAIKMKKKDGKKG